MRPTSVKSFVSKWQGEQHHFVSIISFPPGRIPIEVGRDFDKRWGAITTQVGHGFDGKRGTVPTPVGHPMNECPLPNRSEHLRCRRLCRGAGWLRPVRGLQPSLFRFLHSAPDMIPVAGGNLGLPDLLD
jgi:hypothetical protein